EEVEKDRNPVKYRMSIAHADSPDERIELTGQPTDGWYTVVHLRNTSREVTQLVTSNSGGYGNAWLYVEKKPPGRSGWEPAAQGTFHTTPTVPGAGDVTGVHCGWQQCPRRRPGADPSCSCSSCWSPADWCSRRLRPCAPRAALSSSRRTGCTGPPGPRPPCSETTWCSPPAAPPRRPCICAAPRRRPGSSSCP